VTLSFMGILYWMLPHITGKQLWSKKVAVWQAWVWAVGMTIFSTGMHRLGLLGAPRRTMLGVAIDNYGTSEWRIPQLMVGIGGMVLFVSAVLFFVQIVMTLRSKQRAEVEMPIAEALHPEPTPNWLNNWKPWLAGTAGLIVVAYGPVLIQLIGGLASNAPGFQLW
jgi:cytochrome c oxidase subunit 1